VEAMVAQVGAKPRSCHEPGDTPVREGMLRPYLRPCRQVEDQDSVDVVRHDGEGICRDMIEMTRQLRSNPGSESPRRGEVHDPLAHFPKLTLPPMGAHGDEMRAGGGIVESGKTEALANRMAADRCPA